MTHMFKECDVGKDKMGQNIMKVQNWSLHFCQLFNQKSLIMVTISKGSMYLLFPLN